MSQNNPSLIGSVFERKPASRTTAPQLSGSGKTGFPIAQHRSKSAFVRSREELRKAGPSRSREIPTIIQTAKESTNPKLPADHDDWRSQIGAENQKRVEAMTEEEREEERREIIEKFGAGVGDLLRRVREARERQAEKHSSDESPATGARHGNSEDPSGAGRSLEEGPCPFIFCDNCPYSSSPTTVPITASRSLANLKRGESH